MSLVLRTGGAPLVAFWWWEPPAPGARLAFTSRASARALLARLGAEPEGALGLRRLLASQRGGATGGLDDRDVVEQLAHLLSAGQLRLASPPWAALTARDEGEEAKEETPLPAAAPPPLVEVARPAVATTFDETIDAAVLAAALKEAAAQGVPFCEECLKAAIRKQREEAGKAQAAKTRPAPAPAPETFSPDVDAEVMAQAMKEAAAQGVPFCEECHKAALREKRARAAQAKAGGGAASPAPAAAPAEEPAGETLPEDTDAAATAEAMKAAALDGVPFCEVCMKKELEAKRAAKAKASAKGAGQ